MDKLQQFVLPVIAIIHKFNRLLEIIKVAPVYLHTVLI